MAGTAGFAAPAKADNCCSDLEERIAELEATTAKTGNRKISVKISGRLSYRVLAWDDGEESNVYTLGAGAPSNFTFSGASQITDTWSAGYILQVEMYGPQRYQVSQDDPSGVPNQIYPWESAWYIENKNLGHLEVGKQSQTSDNTALAVDKSGSLGPANWVLHEGSGFYTLVDGVRTGFTWGDIAYCQHIGGGFGADCNGATTTSIRYDTPVIGGFMFSTSYGMDEFWDIGLQYNGTIGNFKLSAAAAYAKNYEDRPGITTVDPTRDSAYTQAGFYVEHLPTGLFVHGAYGHEDNNFLTADGNPVRDDDTYYAKAGIRKQWFSLGHTVLYGEYTNYHNMLSDNIIDSGVTGSDLDRYGLGVVQEIDSAAMSVWFRYRQLTGDVQNLDGVAGRTELDDLYFVESGATINF